MIGDTIVALASPPGIGARAVLRLSGPAARAAAALVFEAPPVGRTIVDGLLSVRGRTLPALSIGMPGPGSFTGEDVVELHLPGAPLLVQCVQEDLLMRGASLGVRLAMPGEFTARACRNGRLDLAQAEGILMLLHAADRRELAAATAWLGGVGSDGVRRLRSLLQDTLALLESGLDFTDDETGAVDATQVQAALAAARSRIGDLLAAIPAVAPGGEVVLVGAANAGKSSLCNALAGREVALVDAAAGTTRDLVRVELDDGVVLWDAPGDLAEPSGLDTAALALRDRLLGRAAAALLVVEGRHPVVPPVLAAGAVPVLAVVLTKDDLGAGPELPADLGARIAAGLPLIPTSSRTGAGLAELHDLLRRAARAGAVAVGAPLRWALGAAAHAVERAIGAVEHGPELAAVELQAALRALDDCAGDAARHSPEELLDRIYGRFCLGK